MTTLKDVARHLGLSPATVSRALNGFPEVGAKTRLRVTAAAHELGYTPNSNARRLATGKTGVVGMIFRSTSNLMVDPHFTDFLAGLCSQLANSEIDLLFHVAPPGQQLPHYNRMINCGAVDGMLVSAPEVEDQRIETLLARNFPFVVHGRHAAHVPYAFYDIDNDGAFTAATRLLCALGHKRIALLNGPKGLAYAEQRERAFTRTIAEQGFSVPAAFISHDEMGEEAGHARASAMLRHEERPTAFICSSSLLALGVYRAVAEANLVIGHDVSVIAHDDVLPHMRTEHFAVPLTVTRAPIRDASVHLADMIAKVIAGAEPKSLQKTETVDLVVRESTGAVPAGGGTPWQTIGT
jgi:LacI family transcriptional regulator